MPFHVRQVQCPLTTTGWRKLGRSVRSSERQTPLAYVRSPHSGLGQRVYAEPGFPECRGAALYSVDQTISSRACVPEPVALDDTWLADVLARFPRPKSRRQQEWDGRCGICGKQPCDYHGHHPVPAGEL